ncbi:MAG TPA: hypothetical protein VGR71_16700 [Nitrospira sp.]|nr:hypothetical protein [Nitrospira sp.]
MSRKQSPAIQVTVTDAQYAELLATRLTAMHGFAEGSVDQTTYLAARAAVRRARKVRRVERDLLESLRAAEVAKAEARKQSAQKAAATRKANKEQDEPVAA